jgi:ABC-type antimicrobial peptide transport system permease subunit
VIYYLYSRAEWPPLGQMIFELRTTEDALNYVKTVREIVRKADPSVPVSNIKTQAAEIEERVNLETIFARLSELFAMLALAITCVGLYGIVSYNVARRTNKIGIRVALGARPTRVVRTILRDVLATVLAGLAIGIPAALLTSKLVSSFLYGLKPNDPWGALGGSGDPVSRGVPRRLRARAACFASRSHRCSQERLVMSSRATGHMDRA